MKSAYRHIYMVQDRNHWESCRALHDPAKDLVLTFDFGLRRVVRASGGDAEYADHLADCRRLEKSNFDAYRFFARWYYDREGRDIFSHRGVDFGGAFRIEIWNDITYYARLVLNFREIKTLAHEKLFVAMEDSAAIEVLSALSFPSERLPPPARRPAPVFFFPIYRWMEERAVLNNERNFKSGLRALAGVFFDAACAVIDFFSFGPSRTFVFLCHYYPLDAVMAALKRDRRLRVVSDKYVKAKDVLRQRRLPLHPPAKELPERAAALLREYRARRQEAWTDDGFDLAGLLSEVIVRRITPSVRWHLQLIDSIQRYFQGKDLRLMVTFTSIGIVNALMAQYCRKRGVPVYLVINGLLVNSYLDEAKQADSINAYGESIKNNYFRGMSNVVCLGDPRMDAYARAPAKAIDRKSPTIVVGTAGFNNIDLNSYVAYEFDFMHDILSVCRRVGKEGLRPRVLIKVRTNGYRGQYEAFVHEYFPDLSVEFFSAVPIEKILERADLYISQYSQTLFEASCLGVPVIYYKNDTEQDMHPPFDGKSELVTAHSTDDLVEKIHAFTEGSSLYDAFLDKKNMEKYVGPLDGGATRRNLERVHALLAL